METKHFKIGAEHFKMKAEHFNIETEHFKTETEHLNFETPRLNLKPCVSIANPASQFEPPRLDLYVSNCMSIRLYVCTSVCL